MFHVAAVAAAIGLVAAACGGGSDTADDGGPIELTVWFGRETYLPTDDFKAFNEAYPDIKVNVDVVDKDTMFERLVRMRDAGQKLPDVFGLDGFYVGGLYEAGIARDIGEYVDSWQEEDPASFDMLEPTVWDQGEWDGHRVAMADVGGMDQIFYRSDWFTELGMDAPTSWEEVLEDLRAIKARYPDKLPWSMQGARGEGVNFLYSQMAAMGVQFDGATPQLDTEAGYALIEFYQTLVREKLTSPDVLSWGSAEYLGAFIGGDAGMMIDSLGTSRDLEPAGMHCNEQWKLANMPLSLDGGADTGTQVAQFNAWMISEDTEHPYEASLVLRYIASPENALENQLRGLLVRHESIKSDEFAQAAPCMAPHVERFLSAAPFPTAPNFFALEDILEQFVQDVLSNPDADLAELAKKWQQQLNDAQ